MDEIDKLDATLARLEAEREQRLAERIEAEARGDERLARRYAVLRSLDAHARGKHGP